MSSIGAVIVTHNSSDWVGEAIDSCLRFGLKVVVVDNASTDCTLDMVKARPKAEVIANSRNRGFAAAANQGFEALDTAKVLLLNPDAVLTTNVEELGRMIDDAPVTVGAAAGRLVDDNGRTQHGFTVRSFPTAKALVLETLGINRLFPGNPVNRSYRCQDLQEEIPSFVEQPAGAFLLVSKEAWERIGGFDEGFFPIWFEDVDFCLRLKQAGYEILYVPHVVAKHAGGHSVLALSPGCRAVYWYGSLLKYGRKHLGGKAQRAVCLAVLAGAAPRMLLSAVTDRTWEPFGSYAEVMRLAIEYLFRPNANYEIRGAGTAAG